MRLVPTRANRQPAAAAYLRRPGDDEYPALALDVLRIEDVSVVEITSFAADLFPGLRPAGDALMDESAFEVRTIAVVPGGERTYREEDWRDALVVVERGEIELERSSGARHRFEHGAVLWLAGLSLRALHNRGREPAELIAVSRRRPAPAVR